MLKVTFSCFSPAQSLAIRSSGISTSRLKSYGAVIFSGDFCFVLFGLLWLGALLCFFRAKQKKYESTGAMMMKTKKRGSKYSNQLLSRDVDGDSVSTDLLTLQIPVPHHQYNSLGPHFPRVRIH